MCASCGVTSVGMYQGVICVVGYVGMLLMFLFLECVCLCRKESSRRGLYKLCKGRVHKAAYFVQGLQLGIGAIRGI